MIHISCLYVIPALNAGLCGAVTRGRQKGNSKKFGVMFVGSSSDCTATQLSAAGLAPEISLTSVSWVEISTLIAIHETSPCGLQDRP